MMTRNKKKAGRGYTREDWIQFNENIVYWSEKGQLETGRKQLI